MRDAWRLAAGTFLTLPVRPPTHVDRTVAGRAMVLAPVTTIPALALWAALAWSTTLGWTPPLLAAALAVGTTTLLSRAMHLDGLADTADGLSASYERTRALAVMRRGDTGPAGVAAIVLTLLVQVAALATLLGSAHGAVLAGIALVASRLAPAVAARRGVPAARPEGLGATVSGSVSSVQLGAGTLGVVLAGALALQLAGSVPYAAVVVLAAALLGAWLVTRRATDRIGGITGDVIGAAIEIGLAAGLSAASVCLAAL